MTLLELSHQWIIAIFAAVIAIGAGVLLLLATNPLVVRKSRWKIGIPPEWIKECLWGHTYISGRHELLLPRKLAEAIACRNGDISLDMFHRYFGADELDTWLRTIRLPQLLGTSQPLKFDAIVSVEVLEEALYPFDSIAAAKEHAKRYLAKKNTSAGDGQKNVRTPAPTDAQGPLDAFDAMPESATGPTGGYGEDALGNYHTWPALPTVTPPPPNDEQDKPLSWSALPPDSAEDGPPFRGRGNMISFPDGDFLIVTRRGTGEGMDYDEVLPADGAPLEQGETDDSAHAATSEETQLSQIGKTLRPAQDSNVAMIGRLEDLREQHGPDPDLSRLQRHFACGHALPTLRNNH